ncbi:zinc finger, CCHC-type containing protein [Tanacetum coccineum]
MNTIVLLLHLIRRREEEGINHLKQDQDIQLRLVLSTEDKEQYLEQPIPTAPVVVAPDQPIPPAALATYNENLAYLGANDMLKELKALYSKQAEQELLQTVREFHTCKQEEGQSVSSYVLKMKSYIDQLERLGHPVTLNLRLHEETLPNKVAAPALHAIRAGKVQKNKNKKPSKAAKGVQGKGKGKKAYANAEPSYAPKPKNPPPPKKDNLAKDAICHHCSEVVVLTSVILLRVCGKVKKLNPGALSLYMGNGQRAAVEAIGNYHLCLPSGLVIVLNNCHYAPSITRGIILVSRLYEDGFINRFELNNAISVSKNNVVYFSVIPRDGVYEIEMSCSNTNDSSMYVVSNKRAKLNLDSSLLWHCCLGHISKKRIEKLQHDGLLNSTDIESLGKCVSCVSGKMARKPYSHQVERAKDILGLIHIDLAAMNVEMQAMKDNDVWELVELPTNAKTVGHKWLFKKKTDMDGAVHTFKSCLVAKGFTPTGLIMKKPFLLLQDKILYGLMPDW